MAQAVEDRRRPAITRERQEVPRRQRLDPERHRAASGLLVALLGDVQPGEGPRRFSEEGREKGTQVVLWKPVKKKETDGERRDYLLLRYFTVFNVEQCDGLDLPTDETVVEHDPIESAEAIAHGYTAVEVRHGGDRAFYSPLLDYVQVPNLTQFDTAEHYYGTLFHELAHSTGHESRLARPSLVEPTGFGSDPYSKEELVAEMAAAFLCGEAGIDVNVEQHAGYIGHWLGALKDDRKLLVQAAAAAQKASDLVLGVKWEKVASEDATTTDVALAA